MSKKHVCIFGQECWCGASVETTTLNGRSVVAGVGGKAGWPIRSDGLGVLPEQIPEAIEEAKMLGVPTDFSKRGEPILTDARHAYMYRRALGYHNRNGFTS